MGSGAAIPLSVPDLRGREIEYLRTCVEDNWVSSAGPFVVEMERRMASLCERAHGVATVSGTAALHLALTAAGARPGDFVVVPDWSFAACANAVYHAGGTPYFVDVAAESWTLDAPLLATAVTDSAHPVGAIVAVHTLGHPANMDAILAVAAEADVPVIEDAAGAIGARFKGRPVGAFGRASCFSFNGNKTVTAGGGGMIVTDDESLATAARRLSTQARIGETYCHESIAWNYRMSNLNAAVGLAQLERLSEMVASKRSIAARYDRAIESRNDLLAMPRATWAESNCWLYSVVCASPDDAESLVRHLRKRGIEARTFWRSLSAQAPYAAAPRQLTGVSAQLSGRVVALPSSSHMSRRDQERVIEALGSWRGEDLRDVA